MAQPVIECDLCEQTKQTRASATGMAILPRGWRRFGGQVWCDKCWRSHYYIAAITIPVLGPANGNWKDLRAALRLSWSQSTALSNWAISELYKADVTRDAAMGKLPKMPSVNLYQAARERFPDIPTGSLSGVLHAVELKYRAKRYGAIWTCDESLPNYRYPTPFSCRRQDWKPGTDADDAPVISCRLAGKRWALKLRRGPGFRRQHAAFSKLLAGEAQYTELALYRQRANGNDHRTGDTSKTAGGGQKVFHRIMAKIVMWLPRQHRYDRKLNDTLTVCTGSDCLLYAVRDGSHVWMYNADHARRWVAEHSRRFQRMSDDRKAERRYPRRRGLQIQGNLDKATTKHRRRMNTLIDQVSASVVNFAVRRKAGTIIYGDSCRVYIESFPWGQLREKIAQKAGRVGIELKDLKEVKT